MAGRAGCISGSRLRRDATHLSDAVGGELAGALLRPPESEPPVDWWGSETEKCSCKHGYGESNCIANWPTGRSLKTLFPVESVKLLHQLQAVSPASWKLLIRLRAGTDHRAVMLRTWRYPVWISVGLPAILKSVQENGGLQIGFDLLLPKAHLLIVHGHLPVSCDAIRTAEAPSLNELRIIKECDSFPQSF